MQTLHQTVGNPETHMQLKDGKRLLIHEKLCMYVLSISWHCAKVVINIFHMQNYYLNAVKSDNATFVTLIAPERCLSKLISNNILCFSTHSHTPEIHRWIHSIVLQQFNFFPLFAVVIGEMFITHELLQAIKFYYSTNTIFTFQSKIYPDQWIKSSSVLYSHRTNRRMKNFTLKKKSIIENWT